ncbi:MAG: hypothetical protein V2A66_07290 [Pseudomonadota bacterium]
MTGAGQTGMGSVLMGAGQMTSSAIGSGIQYAAAKDQMESQLRMTIAQYDHQEHLAEMSTQDSLDKSAADIEKQQIIANGTAEYNKAAEDHKKAEDNLKTATAEAKESRKTAATAKIDTKALKQTFDRTSYSYGNPKLS